ncbi:MATE family efflux transporter [Alkalicoccus urumqiensis]|uniref:MATE family efflux transporter n=1 Tax=Alkalicoccus urumqiensis TaxID=1548213 RepID=A0A2P6MF37_ALKUR|nr:MATE family efflux transporter [Alkalicoccus urumqiensis]PRO64860.1 MATE family efflux transporter [Alkalicoccus urumqiensis]
MSTRKKMTLFALTWPIFIEILLHMLMGNADTLMLSQYDDDAVAAVGVSNQVMMLIIVTFGFVAQGTTILVARMLGASNEKGAGRTVVVSIFLNLLTGLLLSGALILFGRQILLLMQLPEELLSDAYLYLAIVGGFAFVQAFIMTVGAALKSYQFTKDVMYMTLLMNVLNVAGNYVLIFGAFGFPEMGVQGVAVSTALSRCVGGMLLFYLLLKRVPAPLPWKAALERRSGREVRSLLQIGIPSAGEQMAYSASQIAITSFVAVMGTTALTTRVYTLNIIMFTLLFSIAVGQGTQILVGYLIGEKRLEAAYDRCLRSLKIGLGVSVFAAGVFYAFSDTLFSIFTSDTAVIQTGSLLLLMTILLEPGRAFNLIVINSLRAGGDVRFPVYVGILSMWGVAVLFSYTLGIWLGLGLIGIWAAMTADEWIRGLLMLQRWRSRKWQRMSFSHDTEKNEKHKPVRAGK